MALTNATTLADYGAGIGTQGTTLKVDATNKRVGIGTTNPQGPEGSLQVGTGITFFGNTGIVSAIGGKFSGDFTVGGTLTYEDVTNIDAVGIITAQSHVSIADSILHTGDTDTSIRFPAANTFTVETAGSEALRVDSNGRVGIGTDSISSLLQVRTASAGAVMFMLESDLGTNNNRTLSVTSPATDSSTDPYVFNTANSLQFQVDSTNRLHIHSDGKIGIGTDIPGANLHVHGAVGGAGQIYVTDGDAAGTGNSFLISKGGTTTTIKDRQASSNLDFGTADTIAMRINSSQRLLIGATSARSNLNDSSIETHLQIESGGDNNSAALSIISNAGTTNSDKRSGLLVLGRTRGTSNGSNAVVAENDQVGMIEFKGMDGTSFTTAASIKAQVDAAVGTDDMPGRLVFSTSPDGSGVPTERMRIDSSGRVLIGLDSGGTSPLNIEGAEGTAQLRIGNTAAAATDGDFVAGIDFHIKDNNDATGATCTSIRSIADQNHTATAKGTRLSFYTTADDTTTLSERLRIDSSGQTLCLHSTNGTRVLRVDSNSSSYNDSTIQTSCDRAANSAYNFFKALSNNGGDIEFLLKGDGNAVADGTFTGGGADYAEYFEWSDDNTEAEDRRGISVVLEGDKIREAAAGEEPIGVISGNPSVVGDADIERWKGKYLRDDYGTYIQEDYEVEGDDGNTIVQQRRKLNPDYNPDTTYVPREDRSEWDCVGLMGKLRIRKGQITGSRWIKMRDVSDSVEEWLVR